MKQFIIVLLVMASQIACFFIGKNFNQIKLDDCTIEKSDLVIRLNSDSIRFAEYYIKKYSESEAKIARESTSFGYLIGIHRGYSENGKLPTKEELQHFKSIDIGNGYIQR